MTASEFVTLVRLFGDRVRLGPSGEVTIVREAIRKPDEKRRTKK
jgi:hypothetical protein